MVPGPAVGPTAATTTTATESADAADTPTTDATGCRDGSAENATEDHGPSHATATTRGNVIPGNYGPGRQHRPEGHPARGNESWHHAGYGKTHAETATADRQRGDEGRCQFDGPITAMR